MEQSAEISKDGETDNTVPFHSQNVNEVSKDKNVVFVISRIPVLDVTTNQTKRKHCTAEI